MRESRNKLTEKEMELARMLMSECNTTADVQSKLKRLFAGTIEQMLEAEMDEHLGYEKNSVLGNNSGNSRNGYGKKTIISDYGECEISVPRDRNGEFEPKVLEKRQTRTDEIEQKMKDSEVLKLRRPSPSYPQLASRSLLSVALLGCLPSLDAAV